MWSFFFFFQAEDGIRDWSVTGVQTCALPILEEKTRVNGSFVFVFNKKFPVELVIVPARLPLIWTLTSLSGRFFSWSVTWPEISIRVPDWEKARLNSKN